MHNDVRAQIFLAAARGHTETDWFRSYNEFVFGNYRAEGRGPFGPLYVLNDDTLAGGGRFSLQAEGDTDMLLLPIVGAAGCTCGSDAIVQAGQIRRCALAAGNTIGFFNPYEEDLVNFLQLWIRRPAGISPTDETFSFDLDASKNRLIPLIGDDVSAYRLFIAKVEGRQEIEHRVAVAGSGLFVFVIEGAFEVQNRLLEARDGLALRGVDLLEAEALSNDAILLLIELAPFG